MVGAVVGVVVVGRAVVDGGGAVVVVDVAVEPDVVGWAWVEDGAVLVAAVVTDVGVSSDVGVLVVDEDPSGAAGAEASSPEPTSTTMAAGAGEPPGAAAASTAGSGAARAMVETVAGDVSTAAESGLEHEVMASPTAKTANAGRERIATL